MTCCWLRVLAEGAVAVAGLRGLRTDLSDINEAIAGRLSLARRSTSETR